MEWKVKNLTTPQIFAIVLVILGVFGASTAQLTDLFGQHATKLIVSASSLLSAIVAGISAILSGQGSQIQAVQAMPGVDKIVVNKDANSTLATLAVDPVNQKIEAAPEAVQAVNKTASEA